MTKYALTPEQSKRHDEILSNELSAKITLEAALQYYASTVTQLQKDSKALWADIGAASGLSVFETRYEISLLNGQKVVMGYTGENENETD